MDILTRFKAKPALEKALVNLADMEAMQRRTMEFDRSRAEARNRSPEEQLRICLKAAGLPAATFPELLGRPCLIDTGVRGPEGSMWRDTFWVTIAGIHITDGMRIQLRVSQNLFTNTELRFDCGEKDPTWTADWRGQELDRLRITLL